MIAPRLLTGARQLVSLLPCKHRKVLKDPRQFLMSTVVWTLASLLSRYVLPEAPAVLCLSYLYCPWKHLCLGTLSRYVLCVSNIYNVGLAKASPRPPHFYCKVASLKPLPGHVHIVQSTSVRFGSRNATYNTCRTWTHAICRQTTSVLSNQCRQRFHSTAVGHFILYTG